MTTSQSNKYKPGIFNIFIDGMYIDKISGPNADSAANKYKYQHLKVTGKVTAKWEREIPILPVDADEFARKLREIERMEESAGTPSLQMVQPAANSITSVT